MNINIASQNQGIIAWTGSAARPIDLRNHVNFAFTFNITGDIGADTKFEFEWAPPNASDPCIPGAWSPVKEVLSCSEPWGSVASDNALVIIPNGTKAGARCTGALPCKPGAFIRVAPTAGETGDVIIIAVLGGPK